MVRKFAQRPIPDEVLTQVLEAARHAPSGGFSQGFDFVVLTKPDEVEWFYRTIGGGTDDGPSPACIVLPFVNKQMYLDRYAEPDKVGFGMDREENWPVPFWTVDTSMAIMLILLAAVDAGLGAWYFGITSGIDEVARDLRVPASCTMLGVIALGYPSPDDRPIGSMLTRPRRPFGEMFHFGGW